MSNYNKKAELYNYQVDLIGQNEKLVENHNKKLNKQLDDLTAIQEQIALKDRVIELNDELTKKQIRNKKILIGVTGSIAAYKSALLVRLFIKEGAEVKVVMTESMPPCRSFMKRD